TPPQNNYGTSHYSFLGTPGNLAASGATHSCLESQPLFYRPNETLATILLKKDRKYGPWR
ncbi:MAG: hypothetical protein AAB363_09480, partial [Planctomycetota bacterium]